MQRVWIMVLLLFMGMGCVKQQHEGAMESTDGRGESSVLYQPRYVPDRLGGEPLPVRRGLQTAWSYLPQGELWTRYTQEAIGMYGQGLLRSVPRDIERYCPRYVQLNRVGRGDFWVNLIAKLAYLESGYHPDATYTERFYDNRGNRVVSRGLLQISQESANGYGCGIDNPLWLDDPKINLSCGVRIMNRWIQKDGVVSAQVASKWRGLARYWSPFRDSKRLEKIATYTKGLPYCQ